MASPTARVFRTAKDSKASIFLEDSSVSIIGDSRNFITVDNRGITFKGPVSFVSDSLNRRTGGLFVGINDFLEMIPQTIVTPIPSKIPVPPVSMLGSITKDVAFFTSLLV